MNNDSQSFNNIIHSQFKTISQTRPSFKNLRDSRSTGIDEQSLLSMFTQSHVAHQDNKKLESTKGYETASTLKNSLMATINLKNQIQTLQNHHIKRENIDT